MNKVDIQKLIVGHYVENIPEDCKKNISYVLSGDGVWEIRKNSIGVFRNHICPCEIKGLYSNFTEGFELSVPKIPASFLDFTLSYFRQIYQKCSSEVFVQFFYEPEADSYSIFVPEQKVGPASVKYERDLEYEKGKIFVFEIHSHGNMNAFFSSIDNADEKEERFFGVIGKVSSRKPELTLRYCVGGVTRNIEIEELFDIMEPNKKFVAPIERIIETRYVEDMEEDENDWKKHFSY